MLHSRYFDDREIYIVHSMMKTATTSVGKALILLGVDEKEQGWEPRLGKRFEERFNAVNRLLLPYNSYKSIPLEIKEAVRVILLGLVKECYNYSIFSDFPIGHTRLNIFAKKIIFPRAKFIWIDRDIDKWLGSVESWHLTHENVFPNAKTDWDDSNRDITKKNLTQQYHSNRHLVESLSSDFPNDVLFFQPDQGWEPLCSFSKIDIPEIDFPFVNKGKNSDL